MSQRANVLCLLRHAAMHRVLAQASSKGSHARKVYLDGARSELRFAQRGRVHIKPLP